VVGLFFSSVVFVASWVFSGRGVESALAVAGTFLFFWTALWSLLIAALFSFVLFVGGAVLLRLPSPLRALAAPLALTGGVKALLSTPVFAWVSSVALILAGAWTLRASPGGSDGLLGLWLVGVGFFARSLAWSELKSRAKVQVFNVGAGATRNGDGATGYGDDLGGARGTSADVTPVVVDDSGLDKTRFQQAHSVVAEPEDKPGTKS
jgi:hypothetical protein